MHYRNTLVLLPIVAILSGTTASVVNEPIGIYDTVIEMETVTTGDRSDDRSDTVHDDILTPIDTMPQVIHRVAPHYPSECARHGIEGTVLLECLLNDRGTVDSITVVKGIHPLLDSSAVGAIRGFRFSPAIAGGVPVPVLLQYEVPFTLSEIVEKTERYCNLQGQLIERGTRKPVADAMVVLTFSDTATDTSLAVPFSHYLKKIGSFEGQHLEEDRLVTMTDSLGAFRFYSLPSCSVIISAPVPGYATFSERELISPGEVIDVTYYVKRVSYNDYEVVVFGKAEEKEIVRRQLTLSEVKKIPGLGNDAVRVIQALPGVSRPSFGGGDIIVRGAPAWDSKFYLDGTDIPLLYHFGGLKSIYNPDALKTIDFYPGGFGTRYGGAIAGTIEINGRPAKNDRWHGQLDLNLIDGSCLVEGPVHDNISLLVSARRSFIGDLASWYIDNNQDVFPFSVAPYYYDILARADLRISENSNAFISVLHSRDSLGVFVPTSQGGSSEISEATKSLGIKVQFTDVLAGWDIRFSPQMNNSLRYAFIPGTFTMAIFGQADVNERTYIHHFRDELTFNPNPAVLLAVGADVRMAEENLALTLPGGNGIINRDTTNNWWFGVVGAYANVTIKPTERLQLIPGIRYDYYPELIHDGGIVPELWDYHSFDNNRGISGEPSLRLAGRYRLSEQQTLKAAVGNYNQTPQPIGQVIHKTWGDPTIPTTKAVHYLAGYEWRLTDCISADLQCYMNRQWDLPRQATEDDLQDNPGVRWLADGKGRMQGLELMLRHDNNGRFFGWLAYTLSRSERWDPHSQKYDLFEDDETHHVQLVASYHLTREWDIGCRLRYVTGKPTTPVVDVIEYEQYNTFSPVYGEENSSRMDPFFQIDLRIDKKFVYRTWILSTYIDIQNLSWLFYKSPEMVVYDYDYHDKQAVSMMIQPAIGLKAEF